MAKKTVALTGSSGTMGFQGFLELYKKKDQYNIVLLNRDSEKNRKKFEKYMNDPSVKFVWGDLTKYEDVLEMVNPSQQSKQTLALHRTSLRLSRLSPIPMQFTLFTSVLLLKQATETLRFTGQEQVTRLR